MRVKINRNQLASGLDRVRSVIEKNAASPILSCVLMESTESGLVLTATDLHVAARCRMPAVARAEAGLAAVSAEAFMDAIGRLSMEEVEIIKQDDVHISVVTEKERFTIPGFPIDTYPKLPEWKGEELLRVEQPVFRRVLTLTAIAAPIDEVKYANCGVYFGISEDTLTLVACDGKRLAVGRIGLLRSPGREQSFFIPILTIRKICRIIVQEGELVLRKSGNRVLFDAGETHLMSSISEREFSNYEMIFPISPGDRVGVNRRQFLDAIRRTDLIEMEGRQMVKLEIRENRIIVSGGSAREELRAEYSGKKLKIGFEQHLLIDILEAMTGESAEFEVFGSDVRPAVFHLQECLYVVNPSLFSRIKGSPEGYPESSGTSADYD